jgi:hypothetical protein
MPRKAAAADGESAAAEPRRSSRIKDLPRTEVAPKKAPAKPRAKKEVKEGEEGEKPKRGRKRKEAPAENGEEKEEKEPAAKKVCVSSLLTYFGAKLMYMHLQAKPASKAAPGSKPASKVAKPASKASAKPASRATSKKPASKVRCPSSPSSPSLLRSPPPPSTLLYGVHR